MEFTKQEKSALEWLFIKGMEITNSNKKYEIFDNMHQKVVNNLPISGVTVRCSDCKYFSYESPAHDQPYPEFWCSKGKCDGITSYSDLDEPIKCDEFNAL